MPLSALEQAFAENVLIEGLTTGTKLSFALKLKEAQKKSLPQVLVDLKIVLPDDAKRIWKVAEVALKAAPAPQFTFSEGAMMGPYELVEPRGNYLAGAHWRARRPEGMGLLRLVPPGTGLDQDRAQRLIDRANAGVDPPDESILRVDDAGEEFNWLYIGSLGFEGRSLAGRLSRGALPETEAIVLARTLARSLGVAHGLGVVHGGLSTLAVVYGNDGAPKLTDFGIGSVFFDGHPGGMPAGLRLGLLLYAAPELVRGSAETGLDARADLYALGALLVDAVSAIAPGTMKAPDNEPWLVQPPVSDGMLTILRRLLALELDERYPTSDALIQDLERVAAGGLPGPLPPAGPPQLVAPRPSSARPIAIVTPELVSGQSPDESSDAEETAETEPMPTKSEPPAEAEEEAPQVEEGFAGEDIPATIDPDAAPPPRKKRPSEEDEVPETDDPDMGKKPAKLGRRSSQRIRAARAKVETGPTKDHGLVPFLLSLVLVVGGAFGARAATAPDAATRARLELANAQLAMTGKDRNYKKAQEALAAAAESAKGNAELERQVLALEQDLRYRRLADYSVARTKPTAAIEGPRLLEGSDLDCLFRFDQAKRDNPGDAKIWQRIGQDCLKAGFATEAAEALAVATRKDASHEKERALAARAAELEAFMAAGTYPKTTLKKALYVGAHEVTREEYGRWLEDNRKAGSLGGTDHPKQPKDKSHDPAGWKASTAVAMHDRRPATGIDWWDAYACAKGLGCRLPTVAELVAAGTGRFARPAPWGDRGFHPALANAALAFEKQLLPAGLLYGGASPVGCKDLLGNAEEWCAPESEDADKAPVFGGNAETPAEKVVLDAETPTAPLDERQPLRGFRVVLEIE
ncbi:MAG TPA: SUMF1/EgtB/PvdO family nonheme iron enzyme [Planctomycetota bacterium]|nr:SUMF1/EgtB/PvdO family nonheme iron enzyme [Planctomycetota bacterium]